MVRRGKNRPKPESEVKSPCIGFCNNIDFDNNLCLGCFRTIDEIGGWWDMSDEEKRKVLEGAAERSATRFEPEGT
jgi:hypothetical protein